MSYVDGTNLTISAGEIAQTPNGDGDEVQSNGVLLINGDGGPSGFTGHASGTIVDPGGTLIVGNYRFPTGSGNYLGVYGPAIASNTVLQADGVERITRGGTLQISDTDTFYGDLFVDQGSVDVTSGGTLIDKGNLLLSGNSTLSGTIDVPSGGTVLLNDGFPSGIGSINFTGGTLIVAGNIHYGGLPALTGSSISELIVQSGAGVDGDSASDGGTLTVQGGGEAVSATVSSGGTLIAESAAHISGATIKNGGALEIFAGARLDDNTTFSGGTEIIAGGFVLNGATLTPGGIAALIVGSGASAVNITASSGTTETVAAGGFGEVTTGQSDSLAGVLTIATGAPGAASAGFFDIDGQAALIDSGAVFLGGGLTNSGTLIISGGSGAGQIDAVGATGASFAILSGGALTNSGNLDVDGGGGGTFLSAGGGSGGALTLSAGGTLVNVGAMFINGGGVETPGSDGAGATVTLLTGGSLVDSGTITISSGAVLQDGGQLEVTSQGKLLDEGGAVQVSGSGRLIVDSGALVGIAATTSGSGSGIDLAIQAGGVLTNRGVLTVSGGSGAGQFGATGAAGASLAILSGGMLTNSGSVYISGGGGGTFLSAGGGSGGALTISAAATLINGGIFALDAGGVETPGSDGAGGTLTLLSGARVVDSGTVTISAGAALQDDGRFEIASGGTLLNNSGTVQIIGGGTLIVHSGAVAGIAGSSSSGINLSVQAGGALTNSGTLSVSGGSGAGQIGAAGAAGASLAILSGGTLTNSGRMDLMGGGGGTFFSAGGGSGGALTISGGGTLINGGILSLDAGGVETPGSDGAGGTLTLLSGGSLNDTGTLTVSSGGILTVSSGASLQDGGHLAIASGGMLLNNGGTVQIAAGGLLDLQSNSGLSGNVLFTGSGGTLEIANTLTNGQQILPMSVISGFAVGDTIDLANISVSQLSVGHGTLIVGATASGNVQAAGTLNIAGNFAGFEFHYAGDGQGGTDITLAASPTVTPQRYTGVENTALVEAAQTGLLVGATGQSLAASLTAKPADGTVTVNRDGSFSYVPNTNFYGADSFTFVAFDANGTGVTAPQTVNLTINRITIPTGTVGGPYSGGENTAIQLTGLSVTASPNAGDPLSTVLSVAHGTLTVGNQTGASIALPGNAAQTNAALAGVIYAGALNYYGTDTLTLTTTDTNDQQTTSATAGITVDDTATPSEQVGGPYSGNENSAIALSGLSVAASPNASDPLSTTLRVTNGKVMAGNQSGASITLTGTASTINTALAGATYTGAGSYYGADTLTLTTTDTADQQQTSATAGITVNDTTAPGEAMGGPYSGYENAAIPLYVSVTASPNLTDNLFAVLSAAHGTFTLDGATYSSIGLHGTAFYISTALEGVTYTGISGYYGTDTLTLTTTDPDDHRHQRPTANQRDGRYHRQPTDGAKRAGRRTLRRQRKQRDRAERAVGGGEPECQ